MDLMQVARGIAHLRCAVVASALWVAGRRRCQPRGLREAGPSGDHTEAAMVEDVAETNFADASVRRRPKGRRFCTLIIHL